MAEPSRGKIFLPARTGSDDADDFNVPPVDPANLTSIWDPIPPNDDETGFNLIIKGIRVNASSVGDGRDIVANVMVKRNAG